LERRSSYRVIMRKKVFVSASGLSRRLDIDKTTVLARVRREELEPSAFLRRSGKLEPLFEIDEVAMPRTIEAEALT
jgi:hypothetical protein